MREYYTPEINGDVTHQKEEKKAREHKGNTPHKRKRKSIRNSSFDDGMQYLSHEIEIQDISDQGATSDEAMWRAVITQALMDAGSQSAKREMKLLKKQALSWLLSNGDDFFAVCHFAGLDPYYVRRNAKEAIDRGCIWRKISPNSPSSMRLQQLEEAYEHVHSAMGNSLYRIRNAYEMSIPCKVGHHGVESQARQSQARQSQARQSQARQSQVAAPDHFAASYAGPTVVKLFDI